MKKRIFVLSVFAFAALGCETSLHLGFDSKAFRKAENDPRTARYSPAYTEDANGHPNTIGFAALNGGGK